MRRLGAGGSRPPPWPGVSLRPRRAPGRKRLVASRSQAPVVASDPGRKRLVASAWSQAGKRLVACVSETGSAGDHCSRPGQSLRRRLASARGGLLGLLACGGRVSALRTQECALVVGAGSVVELFAT